MLTVITMAWSKSPRDQRCAFSAPIVCADRAGWLIVAAMAWSRSLSAEKRGAIEIARRVGPQRNRRICNSDGAVEIAFSRRRIAAHNRTGSWSWAVVGMAVDGPQQLAGMCEGRHSSD